jgi:predicted ArsR family transcriptional regulator
MGYTNEGIGYQNRDTSLKAASYDKNGKLSLREKAYKVIKQSLLPISADQVADKLQKSFISVRPRITELVNEGRIRDSGKRGKSLWGKTCILWESVD